MASRPGGDGTPGCGEHRWDRTQGVSFLGQCEGRLLTENLDSRLLVRYPSITSYFKFGIQICFSTYVECLLQKNLWFLFCHESSTSHLLDALLTSLPVFQVLADTLRVNRTIAVLDLCFNPIGDAGMKVWWVERLREVVQKSVWGNDPGCV